MQVGETLYIPLRYSKRNCFIQLMSKLLEMKFQLNIVLCKGLTY